MSDANGEFVKVYLYLVRLIGSNHCITIAEIADHFNHTEKDICRAIKYWIKQGLIRLEYNQQRALTGVTLLPITPPSVSIDEDSDLSMWVDSESEAEAPQIVATEETVTVPSKKSYNSTQLLKRQSDDALAQIIYQLEMYNAHSVTPAEFNTLLYIYDELHFSVELLEYLIEYCATNGKHSHRYLETVAISWYERDIHTVEQASNSTQDYNSLYKQVSKQLGITHVLTSVETDFINTWHNDYSFDESIIIEACKRAILQNAATFPYVNTIIENWHKQNVKHLSDIAKLDAEFQSRKPSKAAPRKIAAKTTMNNQFNQFNQRQYDPNDLENMFINEINLAKTGK